MNNLSKIILFLCLGCSGIAATAKEPDMSGSKDHPLVSRYPGSWITQYKSSEHDVYQLATGPVQKEKLPTKKIEGAVTGIVYSLPEKVSLYQVYENYLKALKGAGFVEVFSCRDNKCGQGFSMALVDGMDRENYYYRAGANSTRALSRYDYWAGMLDRPAGPVYVALLVFDNYGGNSPFVSVDVVETKPLETGKVQIDVASLKKSIEREGKVALYGIYFDHNRAEINPKSDPTLTVIADYLRANAKVKVFVVGHTDNTGQYENNLTLSTSRANAVVTALTKKYNISQARLKGVGVGPVAPVTTNTTETGRAMNRRVEIVLQAY